MKQSAPCKNGQGLISAEFVRKYRTRLLVRAVLVVEGMAARFRMADRASSSVISGRREQQRVLRWQRVSGSRL
jgi:hypothetical protein